MGELVCKGAEVEVFLKDGCLEESKVENIGSNSWTTVSGRQIAGSSSCKVLSCGVIFGTDDDQEIDWTVKTLDSFFVAGAARELHSIHIVDHQIAIEVVPDILSESCRQLIL